MRGINDTELPRGLRGATWSSVPTVVSSYLLAGLCLETLRQQVQGQWSQARLRDCLPRLQRFWCSRLRRRVHQETEVRASLAGREYNQGTRQQKAA